MCEYTQLTVVVVVAVAAAAAAAVVEAAAAAVVVVELYHTAIYVTIGCYLSKAMISVTGIIYLLLQG